MFQTLCKIGDAKQNFWLKSSSSLVEGLPLLSSCRKGWINSAASRLKYAQTGLGDARHLSIIFILSFSSLFKALRPTENEAFSKVFGVHATRAVSQTLAGKGHAITTQMS